MLKSLLDRIQPEDDDFLLFLGSYLGPGPDSKGVVDHLIELKNNRPEGSTVFLWGCYEHYFPAATAENAPLEIRHLWANTLQGEKVLSSYARDGNMIHLGLVDGKTTRVELSYKFPMTHVDFMEKSLHDWYQDHDYPFVASHAGFNPHNWQNPTRNELVMGACFGNQGWWETDWRIPGIDIIFSHIPFQVPFIKPGKMGIDLGAGLGGRLCALEYPSKEFHVIDKRKTYHAGTAVSGNGSQPS